jgi:xanthine dehydrogenase YagR molybdenum-binding subunit
MMELIGPPLDRKDGLLKVTGGAKYAAEFSPPNVAHAVLVQSTIAKGKVEIDATTAEAAPGVLLVMTEKNAPPRKKVPNINAGGATSQSPAVSRLLQGQVLYWGQHIAVVVADTLEQAQHAATLLKISYQPEPAQTDMNALLKQAVPPRGKKAKDEPADTLRGDPKSALAQAAVKLTRTYTTPHENHNPMEMHSTIARWEKGGDGEKLTLWDSTQYISGVQESVADALGINKNNIRVICPFVGGGFGSKGGTWPHVALTAQAAQIVKRPVRLMLTRAQMFTSVGYRSPTRQTITLAADADGQLLSTTHDVIAQSPHFDEFLETSALATRILYESPSEQTTHRLVHLDVPIPTYMRAPGESTGVFALECALDELAYALKMDPLELRLANYAEKDPQSGKEFSSKSLRQCYQLAAEKFAWDRRTPNPRSMQEDGMLIGYGMATATYPAMRFPAMAKVSIHGDGSVLVQSGTQDLGTGAYTVMAYTASQLLGVPIERVRSQLGDTVLPHASVSGGSSTTASVTTAIKLACDQLRDQLLKLATADAASSLHGIDPQQIVFTDGKLLKRDDPTTALTLQQLVARSGKPALEAMGAQRPGPETRQYSTHAFGAVFVEVRVDPQLGQVRVPRVVAAYAAGRILNQKTARSQYLGGITFGIGMALHEHTVTDHRTGKVVTNSLADYLVPVNPDIGNINVLMVPEEDDRVNPMGVKGIGEIGIVGTPAAIANAIFHATGKRIRDLPITPDKLL